MRVFLHSSTCRINELIREYLAFHKLGYTESVFVPETGLGPEPLSREYVADELNLKDSANSAQVPLLYGIVSLLAEGGLPQVTSTTEASAGHADSA